jgi:dolichol-phosphate mannosyltransferase
MAAVIDIVVPVHNEGASIEETLREFYAIAQSKGHAVRFIVCEDGSIDDSQAALKKAAETLPIVLLSEQKRKGYSRAVIDGFKATESELIGFIDSDGQCDPGDFDRLYQKITSSGADLVVGYRNPRQDHWMRRLMSYAFGLVYRIYFTIHLNDPSCPYLIIRRQALMTVLQGNAGILKQGFWWEFYARAFARNLSVQEIPISHRNRKAGQTQVYRLNEIPKIAWSHLRGLGQLHAELKQWKSKM